LAVGGWPELGRHGQIRPVILGIILAIFYNNKLLHAIGLSGQNFIVLRPLTWRLDLSYLVAKNGRKICQKNVTKTKQAWPLKNFLA
jgi:putative Ca2+/H+ antiporter (TMEM165/GDT1 family)